MASQRKNPDASPSPPVRREAGAPAEGMRDLPSNFQALSQGEKPPKQRRVNEPIDDPREHGMIPGVTNHDARKLYDARVKALRAGVEQPETLAVSLAEAVLLRLWRAGHVTSFDTFAQDVIGLDPAQARELAREGGKQLGMEELEPLRERPLALWMRTESALLEVCPAARVAVHQRDSVRELRLVVPLDQPQRALEGLAEVGRLADGLAKLLRG